MNPKLTRWIAAAIVILALIGGGLAARQLLQSGASTLPPLAPPTAKEKALLTLINRQRIANGLGPLKYDPVMARSARAWTRTMIAHNFFSHDNPNGTTFAERMHPILERPGRHEIGENIALGSGSYGTAAALVIAWMNSPGHRANILSPGYHRTGFGAAVAPRIYQGFPGVTVVTEDFSN